MPRSEFLFLIAACAVAMTAALTAQAVLLRTTCCSFAARRRRRLADGVVLGLRARRLAGARHRGSRRRRGAWRELAQEPRPLFGSTLFGMGGVRRPYTVAAAVAAAAAGALVRLAPPPRRKRRHWPPTRASSRAAGEVGGRHVRARAADARRTVMLSTVLALLSGACSARRSYLLMRSRHDRALAGRSGVIGRRRASPPGSSSALHRDDTRGGARSAGLRPRERRRVVVVDATASISLHGPPDARLRPLRKCSFTRRPPSSASLRPRRVRSRSAARRLATRSRASVQTPSSSGASARGRRRSDRLRKPLIAGAAAPRARSRRCRQSRRDQVSGAVEVGARLRGRWSVRPAREDHRSLASAPQTWSPRGVAGRHAHLVAEFQSGPAR